MSIANTGSNALTYIFTLIKGRFVQKALKTGSSSVYKTLTDNDLTDTLKAGYDAAATHAQSAHAPVNAQANVIESVKVNGTALNVTEKAVNVVVPTRVGDLENDSNFASESYVTQAIAGIAQFSIVVLGTGEYDASGKPTVQGETNKLYLVPLADDDDTTNNAYTEWLYVNNTWEYVGQMKVDLDGYLKDTDIVELTNAQIQTIWDNVIAS